MSAAGAGKIQWLLNSIAMVTRFAPFPHAIRCLPAGPRRVPFRSADSKSPWYVLPVIYYVFSLCPTFCVDRPSFRKNNPISFPVVYTTSVGDAWNWRWHRLVFLFSVPQSRKHARILPPLSDGDVRSMSSTCSFSVAKLEAFVLRLFLLLRTRAGRDVRRDNHRRDERPHQVALSSTLPYGNGGHRKGGRARFVLSFPRVLASRR